MVGPAIAVPGLPRRQRAGRPAVCNARRRTGLVLGLISRPSYLLMLTALSISPVSYVAPAREIGILFGTLLGVRVLAEGDPRRRVIACAAMVLGSIRLALS